MKKLLCKVEVELRECLKVSDPSVADCVLDIETAIKFVENAQTTLEARDMINAFLKAQDVIPESEDYLLNEIEFALNDLGYFKS